MPLQQNCLTFCVFLGLQKISYKLCKELRREEGVRSKCACAAAALFKALLSLQDAAKQCKAYMDRDPVNINFTMIALAASD